MMGKTALAFLVKDGNTINKIELLNSNNNLIKFYSEKKHVDLICINIGDDFTLEINKLAYENHYDTSFNEIVKSVECNMDPFNLHNTLFFKNMSKKSLEFAFPLLIDYYFKNSGSLVNIVTNSQYYLINNRLEKGVTKKCESQPFIDEKKTLEIKKGEAVISRDKISDTVSNYKNTYINLKQELYELGNRNKEQPVNVELLDKLRNFLLFEVKRTENALESLELAKMDDADKFRQVLQGIKNELENDLILIEEKSLSSNLNLDVYINGLNTRCTEIENTMVKLKDEYKRLTENIENISSDITLLFKRYLDSNIEISE
jgi:methyl-accepting chemotaxis protein